MAYSAVVSSNRSALGLFSVSFLYPSIIIQSYLARNVFSLNRLDQFPAPDSNTRPEGSDSALENDFSRDHSLDLFSHILLLENIWNT